METGQKKPWKSQEAGSEPIQKESLSKTLSALYIADAKHQVWILSKTFFCPLCPVS
jgi:hypothetical protein